ncbi:MAG: diguanylate cyclase domain-containing protein [Chromatiales bacterium]
MPASQLTEDSSTARADAALDLSSQQFNDELHLIAELFENLIDAIAIIDPSGDILWVNAAYSRITGFDRDEVRGRKLNFLHRDGGKSDTEQNIPSLVGTASSWIGELWQRRRDGLLYPVRLSVSTAHGSAGQVIHYLAIFHDIAQYKLAEERLHHLAYHDPLTDLPNDRLFHDRFGQTLAHARRNRRSASLLYIGLNDFKQVNDTRGRLVGDRVLETVSQRLRGCVRESDTVARVGGDEFTIVLADFPDRQLAEQCSAQVAQNALKVLAEPVFVNAQVITVTASIGISLFPFHGDTVSALIDRADTTMYRAKQHGPNTYLLHADEGDEA